MRRKAIIALVFLVAAAVLVESWHAAANAAATGGRPWPWLWPVTLEAFIFVLVLVYWDARSVGHRARTARVFLVLTTVVASAVQILDAPAHWLGWVTAGWTPVALLLSVEFAVGRLYRPDPIPTPLGHPVPGDPDPDPEPEPPTDPDPESDRTRPRATQGAARRSGPVVLGRPEAQVAQLAAQGQNPSQIARTLGLSDRARKGWVTDLYREHRPTPAQVGHPNGQGGGS